MLKGGIFYLVSLNLGASFSHQNSTNLCSFQLKPTCIRERFLLRRIIFWIESFNECLALDCVGYVEDEILNDLNFLWDQQIDSLGLRLAFRILSVKGIASCLSVLIEKRRKVFELLLLAFKLIHWIKQRRETSFLIKQA